MSESKHTPGPWIVDFDDCQIVRVEDEEISTIIVPELWLDNEDEIADAHLIAAAPDLLEALKAMLDECDPMRMSCGEPWCRARAAIAKARGGQT